MKEFQKQSKLFHAKNKNGKNSGQISKNNKHSKPLNAHQKNVLELQKKKKSLLNRVRYNDVDKLKDRLKKELPASGEYLYDYKLEKVEEDKSKISAEDFHKKYKINFEDLPISSNTIIGLQKRKFLKMTEIQRCSIPQILAGRDVLAASKTGSGKTLSYLIPLVERLYLQKWNPLDGIGAIVLLPTRELATQVFEVYTSFTANHDLSVGLLIGGKNVKFEQDNMKGMNVLICTPGRLLHHMEQTPDFNCDRMSILVMDEADQLLEMGFQETLNAIIQNLPQNRQTILFSATLSKNIYELGKLSFKNPEYIFLHQQRHSKSGVEGDQAPMLKDMYEAPIKLTQYYMEVKAEDKLNMLFSFLRSHKKNKVLVFLSTCKQVRFVYECMRRLRLGPPIFELHGRQKQAKRMAIFFTYAEKKFGVLFTTNLAARGLDFPSVEWIVQLDCPEDHVTYVHRVGRTARYKSEGNSLLLLLPSEQKFVQKLKEAKIELNQLKANPEHQLSITNTLQSYLVESVDLKYLAQRAFISYVRSVHFASDKDVFETSKLDIDGLAESFGLIQTPIVNIKQLKEEVSSDEDNDDENDDEEEEKQAAPKIAELDKKKDKLSKLKEKIKKLKELKLKKAAGLQEEDEDELEEKSTKKSTQSFSKDKNQEIEEPEKRQPSNVKHEKLMKRKNQDVLSENYSKLRAGQNDDEDDEEEFLVKKVKTDLDDEKTMLQGFNPLRVSKRGLKKIKEGGYFDGKNITFFNNEGEAISSDQMRIIKYKENENLVEDSEDNIINKIQLRLINNKEQDDENERIRRKEKRTKKKLQQMEKSGYVSINNKYENEEDDEEEAVAYLGSDNDDEEDVSAQVEEQVEEEIEKPKKKKKSSKKNRDD